MTTQTSSRRKGNSLVHILGSTDRVYLALKTSGSKNFIDTPRVLSFLISFLSLFKFVFQILLQVVSEMAIDSLYLKSSHLEEFFSPILKTVNLMEVCDWLSLGHVSLPDPITVRQGDEII